MFRKASSTWRRKRRGHGRSAASTLIISRFGLMTRSRRALEQPNTRISRFRCPPAGTVSSLSAWPVALLVRSTARDSRSASRSPPSLEMPPRATRRSIRSTSACGRPPRAAARRPSAGAPSRGLHGPTRSGRRHPPATTRTTGTGTSSASPTRSRQWTGADPATTA